MTTLSSIVLSAGAKLGTKVNLAVGVGNFNDAIPRPITSNIDQLRNPSRTPMLINKIGFRIDSQAGLTSSGMAIYGAGASIGCRLDLGRLQITAGRFIPIALLCEGLDFSIETAGATAVFLNPSTNSFSNVLSVPSFTWRLPKPLYVPGGEVIVPQFYLDGDMNPGQTNLVVYITYYGWALPSNAPMPDYIDVPYATAWLDSKRAGASDYLSVRSIRSDLKNIFGEDLYVQRLTGTCAYLSNAVGTTVPLMQGLSQLDPTNTNSLASVVDLVANDKITTQIFKSNGRQVARDKTPWSVLFPPATRSFDACGVLRRNEWYQLQSDIKLTTGVPAGDSLKLMAALIGYRKVQYARGSFVEAA